MYESLKRVAAIHDLSGFGRCSLSVILPVLSVMGMQVVPVPNAILSIAWGSMAWSMIFGGIGDFYNVRNVFEQVPKDAYVFNYGIHTYWIEDPRKKK